MVSADANGVRTGLLVGEQALSGFGARITSIYQSIRGAIAFNPFVQLGTSLVSLAGQAETAQIQFEVLLGSVSKASAMLQEIRSLDSKTPIEFSGLRDAAVQLLNVDAAAESVVPMLQMMSETSLGNTDKFQRMAMAMSQVIGAGRLMGGELKQMREAGFNPLQIIAQRTGESMGELTKRMEAGNVSVREVVQAFQDATSESGRYFGLNEKASQSLEGRWSALTSSAKLMATEVGEKLIPTLKSLVETGMSAVEWMNSLSTETIQTTIKFIAMTAAFSEGVKIAGSVVAAVRRIQEAYKGLTIAQAISQAMSGPAGWAILATGLAAAVGAGVAVNAMFDNISTSSEKATSKVATTRKEVAGLFSDATKNVAKEEGGLLDYMKILGDEAKEVKRHFEEMRRAIEGRRGVFPGGANRFSSAGFETIARAGQENAIQKELQKLREAELTALRRIEDAVRANKAAASEKTPIVVVENQI